MKFSRIVLAIPFFFYLISCQSNLDKKKQVAPEQNTIPTSDFKKIDKSVPDLIRKESIQKEGEKKVKKKKTKAFDTLRPVTAIP